MFESIEEYILSHIDSEPPLLSDMARDAQANLLHGRMVSGHLQGRLLKMFARMIRPRRVLEIGTYTGYSAICLAEGMDDDAELYTIEKDDEMEDFIRKYFDRSEQQNKIRLIFGDALQIIPAFDDDFFDMAFIDGDKRQYNAYFEQVLPKIRQGGFILADNTLWNGKLLQKVAGNDWQTKGIMEFNESLVNDKRVEKVILPVRDGLTLIQKK
ncbi:O-methyltransferase [Seramator thermalis]|jgi:predicted O-methyltransferase YrrM|uniref:O-methyltransferase n=1 Tax=Seramator thermalis TaxID=2496270 RepID=UPI000C717146|nr:O-methyltransferase [Seramator thermalis]MBZ4656910.1 O-methyltransferase family protein [Methermicoccus sp.]MDI3505001.1 caffeoyl-CoA O-methyltransferase [Bacteroidota bacterium]PLB86394.1 methyltransferase [Dysgonamonadaceae bacterium]MDK2837231.1 caffeoyl-CoA O-methyltransferase [Bacteroidota bacterium]MDK2968907.1 caffeoyl-CoA O-methyltransferase [Bacteroidota bacterium]